MGVAGLAFLAGVGFLSEGAAFFATGTFFATALGFLGATFLVTAFLGVPFDFDAVTGALYATASAGLESLAWLTFSIRKSSRRPFLVATAIHAGALP